MSDEMSDEELQQLIALGVIPDKQGALDKQMSIAEQLRYHNKPEMRGNGRVQTAANPLEFLVSGLEGRKAGKELDALRKQQDELLKQQVGGRTTFFKNLRRRKPQVPGITPSPDYEGM
jgi:hypothetical protein